MSKKYFAFAMLAAFGFAGVVSAEITPTVKKGSSRSRVEEVQAALNVCNDAGLTEDGKWGPKTTAAVKAFQADNDLSRVGVVGPKTAAALNDCVADNEDDDTAVEEEDNSSTTTSSTTSTSGLCPNGNTLASNCTTAPAGTTTTTTTTLSGAEGNLNNFAKLGAYNSTKVSEGEKDIKVFGFETLARDGDQKIDGIQVAFYNNETSLSSEKLSKYASEISVWLDGVEIGRKPVSGFSSDTSDVYSYRFTGMNGVIKKDQKSQIVIAVSAVGSMDSTDATNELWRVYAGTSNSSTNTNYVSAASSNGRYKDYGDSLAGYSSIDFQKAGGTSSDQKFKVTTASSNPLARTVQVSNTSDTNDVTLLAFDVKAENGAMLLQKLPVTVTVAEGTSDTFVPYTGYMAKTLYLYANGTKIDSQSLTTTASSETITFGNTSKLAYKIGANETVKFEVRADLPDTDSTGATGTDFDSGDTISASVSTTNVTNATVELDNANQDSVQNRSGSATGENQTLRSTGLLATMGTSTTESTSNQDGDIITRTIKIPVTLKAFDDTMYVNTAAVNDDDVSTSADTDAAIGYTVEDSAGAIFTGMTGVSATWTSSDATVEGSAYRIDSGTTRNFLLSVVLTGNSTDAQAQYRIQLNESNAYTNSGLTTGQVLQDLTPANSFETSYYTVSEV